MRVLYKVNKARKFDTISTSATVLVVEGATVVTNRPNKITQGKLPKQEPIGGEVGRKRPNNS